MGKVDLQELHKIRQLPGRRTSCKGHLSFFPVKKSGQFTNARLRETIVMEITAEQ